MQQKLMVLPLLYSRAENHEPPVQYRWNNGFSYFVAALVKEVWQIRIAHGRSEVVWLTDEVLVALQAMPRDSYEMGGQMPQLHPVSVVNMHWHGCGEWHFHGNDVVDHRDQSHAVASDDARQVAVVHIVPGVGHGDEHIPLGERKRANGFGLWPCRPRQNSPRCVGGGIDSGEVEERSRGRCESREDKVSATSCSEQT